MEDKISVKDYLEYLDMKYPNEFSSNGNLSFTYMKAEDEFKFFTTLINNIIESASKLSENDKVFVHRFFSIISGEFWDKLQELKHPTKPKYSAKYAFDVIRTLNCSLEDKLKIAELFEYSE